MSKLTMPGIHVTFTELGISAIDRGAKGTVAIIIRDAAELDPIVLTQASQIPTTLNKENQDYIRRAFIGYVTPPKKVIVYTMTTNEGYWLPQALEYMQTQQFDYLCGPPDCKNSEYMEIASWVKSQRENEGAKFKAVLPLEAADHYSIVNFATETMNAGDTVYTASQYCSRIAGLLAGTPMKISATYAPLPELTDCKRLTREDQDRAVGDGELILVWDGRQVKIGRAVNSLRTTTEGIQDSFKKIKIVEIMDLIRTDITATIEDSYVGKMVNSYDNKMLVVAAVRGYFMGLANDGLVQRGYTVDLDTDAIEQYLVSRGVDTSDMTEQEIKMADTGSHIYLKVSCKILDAAEDFDINIFI